MRTTRKWGDRFLVGLVGVAVLLFVGRTLWSIWFDTLRPLALSGDYVGLAVKAFAIVLAFSGLGVSIYGCVAFAWLFFLKLAEVEVESENPRPGVQFADRVRGLGPARVIRTLLNRGLAILLTGFAICCIGMYLSR
jgi:hypothetical protein